MAPENSPMLSKSDFMEYLDCPKSFWIERFKPELADKQPPSAFARVLMADGYAIEDQAKKWVAEWPDATDCTFQADFHSDEGLFARADLVRKNNDGSIDLFEIKASTSLKGSDGSDHVMDACFQTIVAERTGEAVRSVSVMHVNKEYVRQDPIVPGDLLTIEDVSSKVAEIRSDVEAEIGQALEMLGQGEIDEKGCNCRYKGNRDRQCASFAHLNSDIEEPSAYYLPRISEKKLRKFDQEGSLAIAAINEADLSKLQLPVWKAISSNEAVVDHDEIAEFLGELEWPLYFYDYETFGSAVPIAQGHRPHAQMPVQFSLHRLDEDQNLSHVEYLSEQPGDQEELVLQLTNVIGETGNLVSWNMTFENACNKRMASLLSQHSGFWRI